MLKCICRWGLFGVESEISMKSVRTEYNLIEKEKRSWKAGEIAWHFPCASYTCYGIPTQLTHKCKSDEKLRRTSPGQQAWFPAKPTQRDPEFTCNHISLSHVSMWLKALRCSQNPLLTTTQGKEMNWAIWQLDPVPATPKDFYSNWFTPVLSVAFGTEEFAGKQRPEGKQTDANRGISKSSFLSHAQCMPNLKIPAASSYETTTEEKNRWLKPFRGKKKKKKKD